MVVLFLKFFEVTLVHCFSPLPFDLVDALEPLSRSHGLFPAFVDTLQAFVKPSGTWDLR